MTKKAVGAGPKISVIAVMLAMALGVALSRSADAAGHDGSFVVAAHDAEDDEVGEKGHEQGLAEEHDDQRYGKVCQLPELEAHEDAGQKDGQAQIARTSLSCW